MVREEKWKPYWRVEPFYLARAEKVAFLEGFVSSVGPVEEGVSETWIREQHVLRFG